MGRCSQARQRICPPGIISPFMYSIVRRVRYSGKAYPIRVARVNPHSNIHLWSHTNLPPLRISEVARTFILDGLGLVAEYVDARSAPLRSLPISELCFCSSRMRPS